MATYPYPVHPKNYASGKVETGPGGSEAGHQTTVSLYPPASPASVVYDPVLPEILELTKEIKTTLVHHKAPGDIIAKLDQAMAKSTQTAAVRMMIDDLRVFNAQLATRPLVKSIQTPIYSSDGRPLSRQAIHKRMKKLRQQLNDKGVSYGESESTGVGVSASGCVGSGSGEEEEADSGPEGDGSIS